MMYIEFYTQYMDDLFLSSKISKTTIISLIAYNICIALPVLFSLLCQRLEAFWNMILYYFVGCMLFYEHKQAICHIHVFPMHH